MPTQTEAGKAFEFALFSEAFELLSKNYIVAIENNSAYNTAKKCFNFFNSKEQNKYLAAANAAIKHILDIEPRLINPLSNKDILSIQIVPDSEGIKGDVRDVLFIRSSQNWEIGISAKNNHKAVKHSRLSDKIDFGKEWLQTPCSNDYFNSITPIFLELRELREKNKLWRELSQKHQRFYIPILKAFQEELLQLDSKNPLNVPKNLLSYLLGNKDFYKVIKRSNKTEIFGFNFYGTLNKTSIKSKPNFKVPRLNLPTRIIELSFKPNSTDTLILTCDGGWQISFRIHNASSKVEPSLKFDVNLIGQPQTLYTNHIYW